MQKNAEAHDHTLRYTNSEIKKIRKAQYIYNSAVHPETKEPIARYMRMSSYAIASVPITMGMVLSAPTTFNIVLWQWVNQTYSAGVNYSNRNASSKLTTKELFTAYSLACASSISVGLGIKKILEPYSTLFKGPRKLFLTFLITIAAVGSANFFNLMVMRSKEMRDGIMLKDHEGTEHGKSRTIGKKAVISTALTRVLMPVPAVIIPTLSVYYLQRHKLMPKNKYAKLGLEMAIFFAVLSIAPPLACAVFKQTATAKVSSLEPEFHHVKDSSGTLIRELYYNKGL